MYIYVYIYEWSGCKLRIGILWGKHSKMGSSYMIYFHRRGFRGHDDSTIFHHWCGQPGMEHQIYNIYIYVFVSKHIENT